MKILCGDQLQPECKGYLQKTYDGILQMNHLIGALLNFSRLGRLDLRRESVDISATAREVVTTLELTEPERLIELRIADGLVAYADPDLLRVVLANLLGNAWKYTSKRDLAVIEIGAMEIDGKQAYFVRDNGAGFPKADADKLFVPFQRLPGSEGYKGFGIGLATVERIIQRHGGKIWAEGEPDKGTCIYFTLSSKTSEGGREP